MQETPQPRPEGGDRFEHRLGSILDIARLHRTGVPLAELADLLPADAPRDSEGLGRWLAAHPHVGEVVGSRAVRPGAGPVPTALDERRARGITYHRNADRLVRETFGPVGPLLRCVGITGSAAYLEPEEGDDLDMLIVTRSGALWVFLAYAYLSLRIRPRPVPGRLIEPCLNYVMDDVEARRAFGRPQGFLFAREALTTRPIVGEEYLRGLVRASDWLGHEVPRLYARWTSQGPGIDPAPRPAPRALRILNAALFLPLAAYLQAVGLIRNHRDRRQSGGEGAFRTVTLPRKLMFQSARFLRLHGVYAQAPQPRPRDREAPA